MNGPTLGGFQQFITNVLAPPSYFDVTSLVVTYAYDFALDTVAPQLQLICGQPGAYTMYERAVYNLGADTLINWAQDQPTDPYIPNTQSPANPSGLKYWNYLRNSYGVNNFVAGVVQSTSDEGTSVTYLVPKTFEGYTIGDLALLKTPYGRAYLAIASKIGTLWGLTF
jgi:hypothetical protein